MSTTPMTKIREEWKFAAFRFGVDNLEQEDIADWFINRFQEELEKLEGEVEGMRKKNWDNTKRLIDNGLEDLAKTKYPEVNSRDQALSDVIDLIRQHKQG